MHKSGIFISILVLLSSQLIGQSKTELFDTISKLDSLFFDAFNNCDLKVYGAFISDDYEFYHDKQGMTKSREEELESMTIFCGEQRERQQLRRELVKGSLQVFPMNNYGAIATGEHKFYLVIDKQTSKSVTKAKFTTLWRYKDGCWKMTRTLSYDHQPEPEYRINDETLMTYEGNYQAHDRIVNIRKEGAILRMTDLVDNKEVWNAELLPESPNIFYMNFQNIQVEFISTGTDVEKLVVYENGIPGEESTRIK